MCESSRVWDPDKALGGLCEVGQLRYDSTKSNVLSNVLSWPPIYKLLCLNLNITVSSPLTHLTEHSYWISAKQLSVTFMVIFRKRCFNITWTIDSVSVLLCPHLKGVLTTFLSWYAGLWHFSGPCQKQFTHYWDLPGACKSLYNNILLKHKYRYTSCLPAVFGLWELKSGVSLCRLTKLEPLWSITSLYYRNKKDVTALDLFKLAWSLTRLLV